MDSNALVKEALSCSIGPAALESFMKSHGPLALFALMIASSIASPIPNEVILALAGMVMNPLHVAFFGSLGLTVGGVVCFYAARLGGRPVAKKFVKLDPVEAWFERWGAWAVLVGRLVPFVPFDAISYLSGLTAMEWWRFASLTLLGSIPRCLIYAYAGEAVAKYRLSVLAGLAAALALSFIILKLARSWGVGCRAPSNRQGARRQPELANENLLIEV